MLSCSADPAAPLAPSWSVLPPCFEMIVLTSVYRQSAALSLVHMLCNWLSACHACDSSSRLQVVSVLGRMHVHSLCRRCVILVGVGSWLSRCGCSIHRADDGHCGCGGSNQRLLRRDDVGDAGMLCACRDIACHHINKGLFITENSTERTVGRNGAIFWGMGKPLSHRVDHT